MPSVGKSIEGVVVSWHPQSTLRALHIKLDQIGDPELLEFSTDINNKKEEF